MNAGQLGLGRAPEHHSQNRGLARHRVAWIDLNRSAVSDHNDTSTRTQHGQVFGEIHVCQHLHDEVDTAAFGDRHDSVHVIRCTVIDDVVRALFENERTALVRPRASDHRQTRSARQLH